MNRRLEFQETSGVGSRPTFRDAVREGLTLTQKSIPSRFFYDSAGSLLFERISKLPEYYLTRTELAILQGNASDVFSAMAGNVAMVEFGSGSSTKTRVLIEAALARQPELLYVPIDISRDFLLESSEALLDDYPRLRIHAMATEYDDAIQGLPEHEGPKLFLFLGSNVGNFDDPGAVSFLTRIRSVMGADDRILLGADKVKDPAIIELAYNDPTGVTGEFNKNVLRRINDELDGEFDLDAFDHSAPYSTAEERVEMRLVSKHDQEVFIAQLGERYGFRRGEFIVTEHCEKYTDERLASLAFESSLRGVGRWQDPQSWFSVVLLAPMLDDSA